LFEVTVEIGLIHGFALLTQSCIRARASEIASRDRLAFVADAVKRDDAASQSLASKPMVAVDWAEAIVLLRAMVRE
jgi:hypothetical protein